MWNYFDKTRSMLAIFGILFIVELIVSRLSHLIAVPFVAWLAAWALLSMLFLYFEGGTKSKG
jgi:hypothetical protein